MADDADVLGWAHYYALPLLREVLSRIERAEREGLGDCGWAAIFHDDFRHRLLTALQGAPPDVSATPNPDARATRWATYFADVQEVVMRWVPEDRREEFIREWDVLIARRGLTPTLVEEAGREGGLPTP
jgi:hypothetical protein